MKNSFIKKEFVVLLALVFICGTLLSGCGFITKTLTGGKVEVDKDGGIKVTDDDGGVMNIGEDGTFFEGDDGDTTVKYGENIDLPDNYPKNLVPLVDDAIVSWASASESDGKRSYWISYNSKMVPREVYNYYKDVMENAEDITTWETGGTYTVSGKLDDKQISILVSEDEDDGKKVSMVNINID